MVLSALPMIDFFIISFYLMCLIRLFTIGSQTITLKYFFKNGIKYEGCSNMNASSFISFFTYMLRENGIHFYKG